MPRGPPRSTSPIAARREPGVTGAALARCRPYAAPLATALAAALLLLGPALGPGLLLAVDLGWSPDPRFTPFVTGTGMVAPRAVPSDAAGVVLGLLIGASAAQKLTLLLIVLGCGLGPVALARRVHPGLSPLAMSAVAVAGIWTPFVAERLAVGQWTVLLGTAIVGFALRAALGSRPTLPVAACVALAGVGGANTLVMVLPPVVLALLLTRPYAASLRPVLAALATGVAVAAVWAVPALIAAAPADPAGAQAFRPAADTPLGVALSLLSGGGMWNSATHPDARAALLPSLAATALALLAAVAAWRHRPARGVLGAAGLMLALVVISAVPGLDRAWSAIVGALPGGGLLRDSQKLLAAWVVVLAVGLGLVVEALLRRPQGGLAAVGAVALTLAPLAILPGIAWGLGGTLRAHTVPGDLRATATALSDAPPGHVGALPWNQYRRYPWNGERLALSLAPRMVDQPVLQNDALPLRGGTIAGEDVRAAAVSTAIAEGVDPVAALRAQGVRYVLIEADAGTDAVGGQATIPAGARVIAQGESARAYDLGPAPAIATQPASGPVRVGWIVTSAAWMLVLGSTLARMVRRRRRG
ncbi:MAG: hypothetical protein LCH77_10395 [Actinobacteria bacterium]|nr:hypothetical protein [Actinomycetota bacterium]